MKKIGATIYTHCSNVESLEDDAKRLFEIATSTIIDAGMIVEWLKSEIYKIDTKNKIVSFIESDDFDTAREPQVGNAYTVSLNTGKIKTIKAKGQIYHHKHLFVDDSYTGFDIEESKRWSEKWTSVIPKEEKSRIGYKKYWVEILKKYGLN